MELSSQKSSEAKRTSEKSSEAKRTLEEKIRFIFYNIIELHLFVLASPETSLCDRHGLF